MEGKLQGRVSNVKIKTEIIQINNSTKITLRGRIIITHFVINPISLTNFTEKHARQSTNPGRELAQRQETLEEKKRREIRNWISIERARKQFRKGTARARGGCDAIRSAIIISEASSEGRTGRTEARQLWSKTATRLAFRISVKIRGTFAARIYVYIWIIFFHLREIRNSLD